MNKLQRGATWRGKGGGKQTVSWYTRSSSWKDGEHWTGAVEKSERSGTEVVRRSVMVLAAILKKQEKRSWGRRKKRTGEDGTQWSKWVGKAREERM